MKMKEAYELIIKEYLDKCTCCDECIAQYYCIDNYLRIGRTPIDNVNCVDKIKEDLRRR